jgi:cytochrome c2
MKLKKLTSLLAILILICFGWFLNSYHLKIIRKAEGILLPIMQNRSTLDGSPSGNKDVATLVALQTVPAVYLETQTLPLNMNQYDLSLLNNFNSDRRGGICSDQESVILATGGGGILVLEPLTLHIRNKLSLQDRLEKIGGLNFIINDILCDTRKKFPNKPDFYLSVNFKIAQPKDGYRKFKTVVLSVTLNPDDAEVLYESPPIFNDTGGRLVSSDFEDFFIGFLDGSQDGSQGGTEPITEVARAQDLNHLDGKIVKFNRKTKAQIFSIGHRNTQGLYINDGKIYETEHGPKGGDELNLIEKDGNYGWPLTSHGVPYRTYKPLYGPQLGRHGGGVFKKPLFAWVPSIGISNLIVSKSIDESWRGDFLIASLKNRSLYRLRLTESNSVEFVEQIWIGFRLRGLVEFGSRVFLWTDEGKLIVLDKVLNHASSRWLNKDYAGGILDDCMTCHHNLPFSNGTNTAPTLAKIYGKRIASDTGYAYSDALRKKENLHWDSDVLEEFLLDPSKFAPSTNMSYRVQDSIRVKEVIRELRALAKNSE